MEDLIRVVALICIVTLLAAAVILLKVYVIDEQIEDDESESEVTPVTPPNDSPAIATEPFELTIAPAQMAETFSQVKHVFDSMINKAPVGYGSHTVTVSLEPMSNNDLGYANWQTKQIVLNSAADSVVQLNDILPKMTILEVVLIHEILHTLGLVCVGSNNHSICSSTAYTGAHGVEGYNATLKESGIDTNTYTSLPLEDDGGYGTAHYHIEENGDGNQPAYTNEIMTGWINTDVPNYISRITTGMLKDKGYVINEASPYISVNPISPIFSA